MAKNFGYEQIHTTGTRYSEDIPNTVFVEESADPSLGNVSSNIDGTWRFCEEVSTDYMRSNGLCVRDTAPTTRTTDEHVYLEPEGRGIALVLRNQTDSRSTSVHSIKFIGKSRQALQEMVEGQGLHYHGSKVRCPRS